MSALKGDLWVGRRVSTGGSVLTIAFAPDSADSEIEAVLQGDHWDDLRQIDEIRARTSEA